MTAEELRDSLYNSLCETLDTETYPLIKITDAASERLADTMRNEKGCCVWISRTSIRVPQKQVYKALYMAIGFTLCIETNPQVENAPNYNTVLDAVISAILQIPRNTMGEFWQIYKCEEITDAPGNGLLTVLYPYQQ